MIYIQDDDCRFYMELCLQVYSMLTQISSIYDLLFFFFKLSESSKQVHSNKKSHCKVNQALPYGDLLARCVLKVDCSS